jgi:FkbM family methyltransferase
MPFISYAQNYEDVMLWRALKHISNGFYIDVGANDPDIDSVTKAFYERGWRGINVEPLLSHHSDLMLSRPRDINVLAAAGASNGTIDLWECDVRGWATASAEVAAMHKQAGHPVIHQLVPLTTLTAICEEFLAPTDIHFMKVDVEGFEKSVIDGMDFSRFRPWILVIESTKPNSTEEVHESWEASVLSFDYIAAYFDGLNRFYIAKEHAVALLPAFKSPPNVFDGFKRGIQHAAEVQAVQAQTQAYQAEIQAAAAEAKAQQAEIQAAAAEAKAQQAEIATHQYLAQLHAVYASKSWRVTAPLRWMLMQVKRLRGKGLKSCIKAFVKKTLRKINYELLLRPALRQRLLHWSRKLGLHAKLKSLLADAQGQPQSFYPSSQSFENPSTGFQSLTPRARQIYINLKQAIVHHQKENH